MTYGETVRMGEKHGGTFNKGNTTKLYIFGEPELAALIADVRGQALEEAAGICDYYDNGDYPADQYDCARLIRARLEGGK